MGNPIVTKVFCWWQIIYIAKEGRASRDGAELRVWPAGTADVWGSEQLRKQKSAWDSPMFIALVPRLAECVQAHAPHASQRWSLRAEQGSKRPNIPENFGISLSGSQST